MGHLNIYLLQNLKKRKNNLLWPFLVIHILYEIFLSIFLPSQKCQCPPHPIPPPNSFQCGMKESATEDHKTNNFENEIKTNFLYVSLLFFLKNTFERFFYLEIKYLRK